MTVAELIEQLRTQPQHLQVVVPSMIDAYKVPNTVHKIHVMPIHNTKLLKHTDEGMEEVIAIDNVYYPQSAGIRSSNANLNS